VRLLVAHPDEVTVDAGHTLSAPGVSCYTVHVHQDDIGRALGREGRNAQAVRVIAKAVAKKEDRHIDVEISTESRLNPNSNNLIGT
jgi:predicted RNA-binding protein YlqC (UPF0109 family)